MIKVARGDLVRMVVAVDPAVTSDEDADDTGIVVVAKGPHQDATCKFGNRCPGHGYVLADRTCHLPPHGWALETIKAFDDFSADRVVAETNNGGDMVGETIHAVRIGIPYTKVTATRGKAMRAEPISALYEQGRCHHIGAFADLEDQMTSWTPDADWSPDRLDALVWGLTYLGLIGAQGAAFMSFMQGDIEKRGPVIPTVGPRPARKPQDFFPRRALKQGCRHRWDRFNMCVHCGGERVLVEV